jgi:hypothetical protein
MHIRSLLLTVGAVWLAAFSSTHAQNRPPPAGAILDLAGTPIPHNTQALYSVAFIATLPNTAITFAFREDPAFLYLSNAQVVDITNSSSNLLVNGNFSGGTFLDNGNSGTPIGWTYANIYGATFGGFVTSLPGCNMGGLCWYDGAVQAYDAISQTIPTTVGDTYRISFLLNDDGTLTTFSALSTNGNITDHGGNGADVLVYAQAGLPAPGVPEPSTWVMMLIGFVGLSFVFQRSRRRLSMA